MNKTNIGWTDFSSNLLKYRNVAGETVWACVHASEGCRNCYSEALAKRWGRGEAFTAENMKGLTPYFDVDEARQIFKSKKLTGKKVFVDDMTDLFGEWVSDAIILAHFATFALRPDVTFQVLTKRAQRMCELLKLCAVLPNVHLGVSVEDQKNADERIPLLLETPAAVRWVSIEPLLSKVDLMRINFTDYSSGTVLGATLLGGQKIIGINGIVIGGESGHGHREMPLDSAVRLARKARDAGVAVYVKQDSGPYPGKQGRLPDDVWAMKEWPMTALSFGS